MKVLRVGCVGVRTPEVDAMTAFFRDVFRSRAGGT